MESLALKQKTAASHVADSPLTGDSEGLVRHEVLKPSGSLKLRHKAFIWEGIPGRSEGTGRVGGGEAHKNKPE